MYPLSRHAQKRMQQRAVRPTMFDLLNEFGKEHFDGHGGIIRFFNRASRLEVELVKGRRFVSQHSSCFNCYFIESVRDGTIITVGHRTKSLHRR